VAEDGNTSADPQEQGELASPSRSARWDAIAEVNGGGSDPPGMPGGPG